MTDMPTASVPARALKARPATTAPRVLLAEDDAEMRALLASTFRSHRYEVIEARDGRELLDRLTDAMADGRRVDCIVTDVLMPRLTGTEALRSIRNAGMVIPVVVITAFGDHATRIDAWLLGAVAVLDKPFDTEDLLRELRRMGIGPVQGGA